MERYELGDPVCGVIEYFNSWGNAFTAGEQLKERHKECGEITIYDRMAHYNRTELWVLTDTGLHFKGVRIKKDC